MANLAKKFILGEKAGMTQIFEGAVPVPITVVVAGPCVVTKVNSTERDGYESVQIGFGTKRHLSKPIRGALKDLGSFRYLREFRTDKSDGFAVGDKITVEQFAKGDVVAVSGTTKGKGFQGVVKRHNFKGGPKTHGQKDRHRAPGSIGRRWPQRVTKGRKMAGRMGSDRKTVKHLAVIGVVPEENALLIKGSVPGRRGALLEIRA